MTNLCRDDQCRSLRREKRGVAEPPIEATEQIGPAEIQCCAETSPEPYLALIVRILSP
jgi:hypothetical protein